MAAYNRTVRGSVIRSHFSRGRELARIVVVYQYPPESLDRLRSRYRSHLESLENYSDHEILYLNAARRTIPAYLRGVRPDLVVLDNLFFLRRLDSELMARLKADVTCLADPSIPKAAVTSDESWGTDLLIAALEQFEVTDVFTFAPEHARPAIYGEYLQSGVRFHSVLTSYIDDDTRQRIDVMAKDVATRDIDVGARVVRSPILGRHRLAGQEMVSRFSALPASSGLVVDASSRPEDTFVGDDWFKFLLRSRYTLGVEAGSSVIIREASTFSDYWAFIQAAPEATFEEIESMFFPGMDGNIDYRVLAPRHLEAVLTRTGQVLIEGEYSGVLSPGEHYIELRRDLSNFDEVVAQLADEGFRLELVDRAYRDIVESGRYSYQVYVDTILNAMLGAPAEVLRRRRFSVMKLMNSVDEATLPARSRVFAKVAALMGRSRSRSGWTKFLRKVRRTVQGLRG